MRQSLSLTVSLLSLASLAVPQIPTPSKLPEGPGKALIEKHCVKCHRLDSVTRARNSEEKWSDVVDDMVARGVTANDDEIEQMIRYLALNFGPGKPAESPIKVNINKGAADELSSALSIPKEASAAIVEWREKNGPLKAWEDLTNVPGLDTKQIETRKDRIVFE
jgi:competence ComEA-like helix-hairpin-helix protein